MTAQPPLNLQRKFWDSWAAISGDKGYEEISARQARTVCDWLSSLDVTDMKLLEVGCGTGWLCPRLAAFGNVTATDLSSTQIETARTLFPQVRFLAGDFMTLELEPEQFDVVVTLEVLAHVADQQAFVERIARLLKPNGLLMLATQNRPVLERYNRIEPPGPGQIRRWVDARELTALLTRSFRILELKSITPRANRGVMRLLNSRKINYPVRALFDDRFERLKERLGLGWTLVALARKVSP
ncbi:class I SAM-dependent methyltransferase [Neoaquamicrobium sediminum]|uniref:class I SAM-dependent methyltransferase n=1 Tax=Neoaquamicrobium sediminum TaxID=1849104 RepID=UPI003BABC62B